MRQPACRCGPLRQETHARRIDRPNEERGFAIWVGYDIAGVDDDLSEQGLIRVDDASDTHGVTTFTPIDAEKLGIQRKG